VYNEIDQVKEEIRYATRKYKHHELEILKKQEEQFQFEHFTNEDIWKLGKWMTEEAIRQALPIAISIRLFSGVIAFQYFCKGSKLNNETWMKRKELTVREMEMSSLRMCMEFEAAGKTMEDKLMDRYTYACCGGGFPIRIRNAGVIDRSSFQDWPIKMIMHLSSLVWKAFSARKIVKNQTVCQK
jgi:uncharacterized protein (UPF0303 family)